MKEKTPEDVAASLTEAGLGFRLYLHNGSIFTVSKDDTQEMIP